MNFSTFLKVINFYGRFTPSYTKIGYYARRLGWSSASQDYSGQHWLITGANAGLGQAMMTAATKGGATVTAVARNAERLDAAIAELPADSAARVTAIIADMSLQSETQRLLDQLVADGKTIHVLQNNVGVLLNDHEITSEGREKSFVTNVLSHFLLTEGLLEKGILASDAVIVNMSSGGMYNAPQGYQMLNNLDAASYNGKVAYAFAKRAQVALTNYWNEQHAAAGLRAYVTHPGWSKTPGVKFSLPLFWKIQNILLRSPLQGADTAIWLASARPEIGEEETIWFDRKARSTHMYDRTRKPMCTLDELIAYLREELQSKAAA